MNCNTVIHGVLDGREELGDLQLLFILVYEKRLDCDELAVGNTRRINDLVFLGAWWSEAARVHSGE